MSLENSQGHSGEDVKTCFKSCEGNSKYSNDVMVVYLFINLGNSPDYYYKYINCHVQTCLGIDSYRGIKDWVNKGLWSLTANHFN